MIKLIDLSENKNLQTVVDKEKGEYLGHVSTAILEDGKTMHTIIMKVIVAIQVFPFYPAMKLLRFHMGILHKENRLILFR